MELGASDPPRIDVFNKCDRVEAGDLRPHGTDICAISARTGEGVDRLLEMIDRRLDKGTRRVPIHLPYDKGGLLDMLYRDAKVKYVSTARPLMSRRCVRPGCWGRSRTIPRTGSRRKRIGNDRVYRSISGRGERVYGKAIPVHYPPLTRWRRRRRPAPVLRKRKRNTMTPGTTAGATFCRRAAWSVTPMTASRRARRASLC